MKKSLIILYMFLFALAIGFLGILSFWMPFFFMYPIVSLVSVFVMLPCFFVFPLLPLLMLFFSIVGLIIFCVFGVLLSPAFWFILLIVWLVKKMRCCHAKDCDY